MSWQGAGRWRRFCAVRKSQGAFLKDKTKRDRPLLYHHPLYLRFVLSCGGYPNRRCPDPGPERVRANFARLKALGYTGVKLCLWYPPQYFFALANKMGILPWVEFSLWTTPSSTPALFRRLDTRQVVMEDYAVGMEVGRGRVILTALRLDGGLGDQPSGITRSPAGVFLLAEWVRYLQEPLGFHFGFI